MRVCCLASKNFRIENFTTGGCYTPSPVLMKRNSRWRIKSISKITFRLRDGHYLVVISYTRCHDWQILLLFRAILYCQLRHVSVKAPTIGYSDSCWRKGAVLILKLWYTGIPISSATRLFAHFIHAGLHMYHVGGGLWIENACPHYYN